MRPSQVAALRLVQDPVEVRAQVAMTLRAMDRRLAGLWRAHNMQDPLSLDACADLVQHAATLIMLAQHTRPAG